MKITKFVHSCLLVEAEGKVILVDPGDFSWGSGTFDIVKLNQLDKIVITHEHSDHFCEPFVKALAEKFPAAAEMVLRLKPRYAIPVHDWHWNDRARQMEYDRYEEVLARHDIAFIKPVDGQAIEV